MNIKVESNTSAIKAIERNMAALNDYDYDYEIDLFGHIIKKTQ